MASRRTSPTRRKIALPAGQPVVFLMSGDPWSGAMQAGALDALATKGILPSCIIASGFGAVNAVIAAGNSPSHWQKKLATFWMAESWIEWLAPELVRGGLSVAAESFKARLDELVDWQKLNAQGLRCRLIQEDSNGAYRTLDTAVKPIDVTDVLASVMLNGYSRNSLAGELEAPEDAALRQATEMFGRRWRGFEIGLPPAASSPPDDTSRARYRDWIERWNRRGEVIRKTSAYFQQIPGDADRRRPSQRSFRPESLMRTGQQGLVEPVYRIKHALKNTSDSGTQDPRPLLPNGNLSLNELSRIGLRRSEGFVGLLYKTLRKPVVTSKLIDYSGERDVPHYGAAEITIPKKRGIGSIGRPFRIKVWAFDIEQKTDPKKHFTLKAVTEMSHNDWLRVVEKAESKEALVFVHGFNVTFQAALFRFAQVVWDLRYEGLPILYSWASRGEVLDYGYDRNSALIGRAPFLELLGDLASQGITRIHILAHSMGNFLVLDALATHLPALPLGIDELVMAAPDVDTAHYLDLAPKVRKLTKGMTLYASSSDKALAVARKIAGAVPRAGDVVAGKPVIIGHVDSIDATAVGSEMLGLNHSNFAKDRSILSDIKRILADGKRPPPARGVGLDPMPDDVHPVWWRFAV